jgi:hypothetical protein
MTSLSHCLNPKQVTLPSHVTCAQSMRMAELDSLALDTRRPTPPQSMSSLCEARLPDSWQNAPVISSFSSVDDSARTENEGMPKHGDRGLRIHQHVHNGGNNAGSNVHNWEVAHLDVPPPTPLTPRHLPVFGSREASRGTMPWPRR